MSDDLLTMAREHADALRNYRTPAQACGTVQVLDLLIAEVERLQRDLAAQRALNCTHLEPCVPATVAESLRAENERLQRSIVDIDKYQNMHIATPHGFRCRLCQAWWAWDAEERHKPTCPLNIRPASEAAGKDGEG